MKKALKISGTEDTPEVLLDEENNIFSLSGRSLPEDAKGFYRPVIEWMKEYVKQPLAQTALQVRLNYFNSNSVKQVLDILLLLEETTKVGKNASVIWWYTADDDLMEIKGREFKSMIDVPFEFRVY